MLLFKYILKRTFFSIILLSLLCGCKHTSVSNLNPCIISKPITFDAKRIKLTQTYRLQHYGIKSDSIVIQPKMIVLHWTGCDKFQEAYATFFPAVLSLRPELQKGGELNVSAHFLVDRDGKIYQLMPTNWMARHTIGLNNIAIGIENVGGRNDVEDLTDAQLKANVYLVHMLKKQYPTIQYVIGHYEYGKFRHTKLWQEKDPKYFTQKSDPGPKFMRSIRISHKEITN